MPSRIYPNVDVHSISVGANHSAGISNGTLLGWGSEAKGKLNFKGGEGVTEVSCGYSHTAFLCGGRVFTCGNEMHGKRNPAMSNISNCIGVRTSRQHTAVMCEDGTLHVFGPQDCYSGSGYAKNTKDWGMFSLTSATRHFDISDDGSVAIAQDGRVCVFGNTTTEFELSDTVGFIQSGNGIAVTRSVDGVARVFTWGDQDKSLGENIDGELCEYCYCFNDYAGMVTAGVRFVNNGKHFGSVSIPSSWYIKNFSAGENGYAMTLNDEVGSAHLVLVGNNTINKELVIKDKPFMECPRSRTQSTSNNDVYVVRPLSQDKTKVAKSVSSAKEIKVDEPVVKSAYHCGSCNFKFLSSKSACPICGVNAGE